VAGRFFFGCEPHRGVALVDRDPVFGTDRTISALLDFGGGRRLEFTASTQTVPYQRIQLIGTERRLEIEIPFNAPLGGATTVYLDDGSALGDASSHASTIDACDMYTLQGEAFSRAVRGEMPLPYGVEDAILNMLVIDALFASSASERWERV
jgi:predicted dehydrogenase